MISRDGVIFNYYYPNQFYLDWSKNSVKFYGENNGLRNKHRYFQEGITYSDTGVYAPIFRLGCGTVFGHKGATIFTNTHHHYFLLGVLCSKIMRYMLKTGISHGVDVTDSMIKEIPTLCDEDSRIIEKVENLVKLLKAKPEYDYQSNEQREIDQLVYELYCLNEGDVQEVERWYARRYPRLSDYAYVTPNAAETFVTHSELSVETTTLLARITRGENKHVEFKSTLLYDIRETRETEVVKHSVLKTLAAFTNTEGGTLLIGVRDEGDIFGLAKDNKLLGVPSAAAAATRQDTFRQRLDSLTEAAFDNAFSGLLDVAFVELTGKEICVASVRPSAVPYYLQESGGKPAQFFIRRLSSSVDLTLREQEIYARNRWK